MACTGCRGCASIDALLLGFDLMERALGYRGCDPHEQCPQRLQLTVQPALALTDAIDLHGQCERIEAAHRSTPQDS
jgi:hypothetical protein